MEAIGIIIVAASVILFALSYAGFFLRDNQPH
jgi:hypothetical protein